MILIPIRGYLLMFFPPQYDFITTIPFKSISLEIHILCRLSNDRINSFPVGAIDVFLLEGYVICYSIFRLVFSL